MTIKIHLVMGASFFFLMSTFTSHGEDLPLNIVRQHGIPEMIKTYEELALYQYQTYIISSGENFSSPNSVI